jgi:T-complex protein 1 subunit alpha
VLVTDPSKLAEIRQREEDITKERIKKMLAAGANVVLTTGGIDDSSLKYFVEAGAIAVRRCNKADLRHIAKCTGADLLVSLANESGEETVEASSLGEAELVEEVRVGDGELLYIRGCKSTAAQTIILRGANDYMLDEIDRSLHDALCVIKRVLESNTVVPGGGCVETAVSIYLEHLADTMSSKEQLAVAAFSRALLVIPKTLAINGALDATELVSKLRAYHNASQIDPKKADFRWTGLDLENGKVRNNLKAGVLEPAISKVKSIRFATEAAITILRIDDSIVMSKKNDPRNPVVDEY